jgi:hypothetical protein
VPWTFGGVSIDTELAIDYQGTWLEYPEIVILGPLDDFQIEHMESGDILDFEGASIESNDYYRIDLRYGYKTVLDSTGVNKVAGLTTASDLATWRLQPGTNTIRFAGMNAGPATRISINYYNRYLGI